MMVFDLIYKIVTIVVMLIAIIILLDIRKIKKETEKRNLDISKPKLPEVTVEYNEDEIIKHLDYIIDESINTYILFNITPKNVYYINKNMEDEMVNNLMENIPERISQTLLVKLSYIYNEAYIGKFLGEYIYMKITEVVIAYNTENGANK